MMVSGEYEEAVSQYRLCERVMTNVIKNTPALHPSPSLFLHYPGGERGGSGEGNVFYHLAEAQVGVCI